MYYERLLKRKNKVYISADQFLADCVDYFKWCEEHPLLEEKAFSSQGIIIKDDVAKMRPFTKKGLATFLGIPEGRLDSYKRKGGEWAEVAELVEQTIWTQKFEGAACGLLNANLISREIGLADKQEIVGGSDPQNDRPLQIQLMPVARGTFLSPDDKESKS